MFGLVNILKKWVTIVTFLKSMVACDFNLAKKMANLATLSPSL